MVGRMERMRSGGASKAKRVREEDAEEAAPQGDSTSRVMGQFHTLLKQKSTARNDEEREAAQRGLDELGGMAAYQQLSLQMGFDASSYVIETLAKEGGSHNILDVGAIVHRYPKKDSRVPAVLKLNVKSIDLHSQDPLVQQADFFPFAKSNKTVFDAVVLSLVLNYVAEPLEVRRANATIDNLTMLFCFLRGVECCCRLRKCCAQVGAVSSCCPHIVFPIRAI